MIKLTIILFLLVLSLSLASKNFCEDWTLCHRVRCAPPKDPCPEDKPYLLYGQCGCCQFCSETPRIGPCGECGKDVVCRTEYPECKENQTVTLDYCGCCKTCKTIVELGGKCENNPEKPSSTVCAAGLHCVDDKCVESNKDDHSN